MSGQDSRSKIVDHAQLLRLRDGARAIGERVVQCHGCFDIVHPGHVRHLRFAKAQGERLLVTITGDAQINKGQGRPLIPEELRAENLAALDFVDWVLIDPRPTAAELLGEIKPDVYIKGREYETNNDPRFALERETVEAGGGRVVFSSGDVVFSSTALIRAMESSVDPFHARMSELHQRPELSGEALFPLLSSMRNTRIVIVGEAILDTYVLCDQPEVAGESPVMTLRPLEKRHYDGGAAVLARHAAALGARPILVTALPDDAAGEAMKSRLLAEGIDVRALPVQRGALAEKQRFLVGAQKVMKVDLLEHLIFDASETEQLVRLTAEAAEDAQAAIVADFGLGLLAGKTAGAVCATLRPEVEVLSGDVSGRRSNLRRMRGLDLICPSEAELRDAYREYGSGLPAVVWKMLEDTASSSAIVTMGAEGLLAFKRLESPGANTDGLAQRLRSDHVPALTPHAIDALGCGDSMLASATLALTVGGSLEQAAYLGAAAASIEAQRVGNVPVGVSDLRGQLARLQAAQLAFAPSEVVTSSRNPQPAA